MVPLEIEVISRETIKPSSSTPSHLSKYQFSFLDQISPPIFMPLIFFYPPDIHGLNNTQRFKTLKKSLSEALTRYYPMAGRAIGNLYNDCNDDGVPYVQARSNCQLSDIISDPIPNQLNELFPCKLDETSGLSLVIQVTSFTCGGLALALGISHKIADALSCFMFINCWAALARGESDNILSPQFEAAKLFPPKDMSGFKAGIGIAKEKIVTKRYVINTAKITILKDKYAQYTRRPTRIEALSAFLWGRFASAIEAKADPNKIYSVLHAVNLRTRMDPPIPENYFGNISRLAVVIPSMEDEEECNYGVLNQMRDAIANINGGYVDKIKEGDNHLNQMKERGEKTSTGEVVSFSFSSLCRFPLYEADFGWGKPIWVASASFMFKNLICFLDTPTGDGIEVWVNLKEEDMVKFEADKEFLSFVSN